jgi:PAS domain S-box-containing protein
MLDVLVQGIKEIGFQRVRLYLLAEDGRDLIGKSQSGMDETFIGARWPIAKVPFFSALLHDPAPRLFAGTKEILGFGETALNGDEATEWACSPIVNGNVKGLITVDNKLDGTPISKEMLARLSLYAAQASDLVTLAQDFTDAKSHASQMEALQRTMFAVTSSMELPALLNVIIQNAVQLLAAEGGGIYEYYPEQGELIVAAEHNRASNVGKVLKVGEGMSGRLVQDVEASVDSEDETLFRFDDGTPYRVVDDYNNWSGRASLYADGRPFEAVLEVPLKWQNKIVGVIYVDDHMGRHFTPQNAILLRRFADNAAIAMVTSSLRAKSETKLKKLGRLAQVMKELMGDLDKKSLEERLDQVALYAAEILEAEVCGVFLVKEPGVLSLEASFGHREGAFQKGKRLSIRTGIGTGLTGHIAAEGVLFNQNGTELNSNPAIRGVEPDCSPSLTCYSLLAIPLKSKSEGKEGLVGLIRSSNKKDAEGRALPTLRFSKEDEWILTIFAEAVVTAIEGARLVNELSEHKDKLSRVVASSPSCIIAADKDGNITEFNDQARRILGYAPTDLIPAHVREVFLSEKDARRVGAELHQHQGAVEKFKIAIRTKDGSVIPILLSATWLYNAGQERVGSVGYFEDLRPVEAVERRLKLFLEANSIVATAASPSQGLQNLARKLISLLNNSFCRILLLDEDGQHLTVSAAYPISRKDSIEWNPGRGERVAISDYQGLSEFLKRGEPTVVRWADEEFRPLMEKFSQRVKLKTQLQALLMVPLRLGEEVVGLLDIGELREEQAGTPFAGNTGGTSGAPERRSCPPSTAFSDEKVDMVTSVAAQTSFLIERIKLFEVAERRRQLLERLAEKALELRSVKELKKLQYDVVRLAIEMLEGKDMLAGVLFVNHRLQKMLEPKMAYDLKEPTETLSYEDGPIGKAGKLGKTQIIADYDLGADHEDVFSAAYFHSMIAIPLSEGGQVNYVLAIANRSDSFVFGSAEQEVLERFAAQAAVALQTAELLSPEQRRTFNQLGVLHQLTEYILSEKNYDRILDAVLTGITAGYGLGFNRAALLLLDDGGEILEGTRAIGHVSKGLAEKDWDQHQASNPDTFPAYLKSLKAGSIPSTPLAKWVKGFRLPVATEKSGYFKHAVRDREWSLIPPSELKKLPREFLRGFMPSTELVIIPLHTREKSVGVLVADNKFNNATISPDDIDALMTFANTIALAIDNLKLLQRIEDGRARMHSLFEAGTTLRTSKDPNQVLADIVELTHKAAEAAWVRIILIDEMGRPHDLIAKGTNSEPRLQDLFLPGGIGATVMATGKAVEIENTHSEQNRDRINPALHHKDPQALLCLPLAMQGRSFGVMWIGFEAPRSFPDIFKNALQLYVNQAAIAYDSARRMEELEQMRLAAEALAAADDPQSVLVQIVKRAHTALRADSAAIWTYDDVRDEFEQEGWVSSEIAPELKEEFWKAQPRFNGTASTVMRKGLIKVTNVQNKADYPYLGDTTRRLLERIRVQSFLGLSLTVGEQRLGVLYLNYNRHRNFSDEEMETASIFANHAALALHRAKLLKYVQRTKKATEAVARVTVAGNNKQTLQEIVNETKGALACDAVVLFVFDKSTNTLVHPPYMDDGVWDREAAVRDEGVRRDSIVYKILDREEAEFIKDAEHADLTARRRFRKAEKIKSLVAIPLKADGEKVGVMFVNYRREHVFNQEEMETILGFANQAAAAIRNAQLIDMRLREQSELLDLSREMLRTAGLKERMQAAVDRASKMLRAAFCAILLPVKDGDEFVFSAAHGWDPDVTKTVKLKAAHGSQTGYTIEQREAVRVADFSTEARFDVHPIIKEMGFVSSVSVPMFQRDKPVGVILLHTLEPRQFSDEEVGLLTLIASQAAFAIESSLQYEEVNRKRVNLDALYEASKAITASFRPDRALALSDKKLVLDEIIKQAVEGITPAATLGMIKLYDAEAKEFSFESVYPPERKAKLLERVTELTAHDAARVDDKPKGVVGMAVKEGQPQLIPDVSKCNYYIVGDPDTCSQLAVPLIIEDRVLGVINVESDKPDAFEQDDVTNLKALAELAVVVIKNSELFNELIETKSVVDASNALALMGMTSSMWRHAINGHAINIKNLPTLMRMDIRGWNLGEDQATKMEERFQFIENMSEKILQKEVIPPLSYESTVRVESINGLIRDRVVELWKSEPHSKAEYTLNLANQDLNVRVSPEWCRRALDILIDNAVSAVKGLNPHMLTISTCKVKNEVHISVSDTGRGIPAEKIENLFKRPLGTDERDSGFGVGLLIAKTIVETYKGKISLQETSSHGTTFIINLPAAD